MIKQPYQLSSCSLSPNSGLLWKVKIRNKEFTIKVEGDNNRIIKENKKRKKTELSNGTVSSSIPGKIIKVNYDIGDLVNEGDVLLILEAMKMQQVLSAPFSAKVDEVAVQEGAYVEAQALLTKLALAESLRIRAMVTRIQNFWRLSKRRRVLQCRRRRRRQRARK